MAARKGSCHDWNAMFDAADTDGNGFLTIHELAAMLRQNNSKMSDRECCELFIRIDGASDAKAIVALMNNPDEKVTKEKYIAGMTKLHDCIEQAEAVFQKYDKDGSGFLERSEVVNLIKEAFKKSDAAAQTHADEILRFEDSNNDGKISREELMDALC